MYFFFIILFVFNASIQSIEQEKLEIDDKTKKQKSKITREINVYGKDLRFSASEGSIKSDKINQRPLYSVGDIADLVPGVVSTGHSGLGKANQYFLRGFNLDHGTDFSTSIDGVLINNPSHVHGQGYNDINFIIPEIIQEIKFKKGVYSSEDGNFSSAGSMRIQYKNELERGISKIEAGSFGHRRILVADSYKLGLGKLLIANEVYNFNGPWSNPDHYKKLNSVIGYGISDENKGFQIKWSGYKGTWNATNQVPERAFNIGKNEFDPYNNGLNRFDTADSSDGGKSARSSLTLDFYLKNSKSITKILAYHVYYDLDLFSNFTLYLKNPDRGDQIEQKEFRNNSGVQFSHTFKTNFFDLESNHTFGIHFRRDYIQNSLSNTQSRIKWNATKDNRIIETNLSPYYENQTIWSDRVKTQIGVRGEFFHFNVEDRLGLNPFDGSKRTDQTARLINPKFGMVIGIFPKTNLYLNAGYGFHSNDARGLLIPFNKITPLSRSRGQEIGLQFLNNKNLTTSLTLWRLDLDSELVFLGDEGTTSPTRGSNRKGIEFNNTYNIWKELSVSGEFAISSAKYNRYEFTGNHVPLSARRIFASTIHYENNDFSTSLQVKYFGPRPLDELDSVRSSPITNVNFMFAKNIFNSWNFRFEIFNLMNKSMDRIQYYYPTRLRYEPIGPDEGGYNDKVVSPMPGRNFRFVITKYF